MSEEFTVGQRVCAKGQGTDAAAHWHGTVEKVTKTQFVVSGPGGVRRFRRGEAFPTSIPYSPYGGSQIYATCQEKEKK